MAIFQKLLERPRELSCKELLKMEFAELIAVMGMRLSLQDDMSAPYAVNLKLRRNRESFRLLELMLLMHSLWIFHFKLTVFFF